MQKSMEHKLIYFQSILHSTKVLDVAYINEYEQWAMLNPFWQFIVTILKYFGYKKIFYDSINKQLARLKRNK